MRARHDDERDPPGLPIDPGRFLAILEAERTRLGVRVGAFARAIGVTPHRYSRWSAAKDLPRLQTLLLVATRLGWLVDELLEGANPEYDAVRVRRLAELVRAATGQNVSPERQTVSPAGSDASLRDGTRNESPAGIDTAELSAVLAGRRVPMTDSERLIRFAATVPPELAGDAYRGLLRIVADLEQRRCIPEDAAEGGSG